MISLKYVFALVAVYSIKVLISIIAFKEEIMLFSISDESVTALIPCIALLSL